MPVLATLVARPLGVIPGERSESRNLHLVEKR
jgi:hypothetical protein